VVKTLISKSCHTQRRSAIIPSEEVRSYPANG